MKITTIESITLGVDDANQAEEFYRAAFGLEGSVLCRASTEPTSGFRGFALALNVAQPSTVDALTEAAAASGATLIKPPKKSLWGYGAVLQAPDGSIWKVASSAKKDSGPATRDIDQIVLLLGAADVAESKRYYTDRGLAVAKSFGGRYAEFDMPASPIKLALLKHGALAKDLGVPADGSGSHRLTINSEGLEIVDPDGFTWATASR